MSPSAAALWQQTTDYTQGLLNDDMAASPLITGSTARLLAATALTVFPNDVLPDPTRQDTRDAHTGTLRRAIAFIDEHAHEDITVDIAAAAFVTVRAVQLAFRHQLDTTPLAYLRSVRLRTSKFLLPDGAEGLPYTVQRYIPLL